MYKSIVFGLRCGDCLPFSVWHLGVVAPWSQTEFLVISDTPISTFALSKIIKTRSDLAFLYAKPRSDRIPDRTLLPACSPRGHLTDSPAAAPIARPELPDAVI